MSTPATGSSQNDRAFRLLPVAGDHQRDHEVPEAREDGDDEQEDEQRGVDGEQAVVGVRVDELRPRLGQLGAHQHRDQAADEQEDERVDRVLDADHLVIGVDPEVVPPGVGAVGRVVLRARRAPDRPVEPVVEAPDPDQEGERHGDQRDRDDRFAGEVVLEGRMSGGHAHQPRQGRRERDASDHHQPGAVEARSAEPGRHQCLPSEPVIAWPHIIP